MLRRKICFSSLILSAGLMVLSATDLPAREMERTSVNVHTADLNLASDQGRAVLDARIAHAVNQICGDPHARSTWDQANYANCSKQARADVQARVDAAVAAAENARRMAGGNGATPVR
jgi:UrcA family protein